MRKLKKYQNPSEELPENIKYGYAPSEYSSNPENPNVYNLGEIAHSRATGSFLEAYQWDAARRFAQGRKHPERAKKAFMKSFQVEPDPIQKGITNGLNKAAKALTGSELAQGGVNPIFGTAIWPEGNEQIRQHELGHWRDVWFRPRVRLNAKQSRLLRDAFKGVEKYDDIPFWYPAKWAEPRAVLNGAAWDIAEEKHLLGDDFDKYINSLTEDELKKEASRLNPYFTWENADSETLNKLRRAFIELRKDGGTINLKRI